MNEKKKLGIEKIRRNTILLIIGGILVNLIMSEIVILTNCPIYLDTIGTIFVAGEAGMLAGVATALVTNLLAGLFSEGAMYFAIVSVLVAVATAKLFLKRVHQKRGGLIVISLILAVISGISGSAIEWVLYGEPGSPLVAHISDFLANTIGVGYFPSFLFTNFTVNLTDKLVSVFAAYGVMCLVPRKISDEIRKFNTGRIEANDEIEGMTKKDRKRLRRNFIILMSLVSVALSVAIAWISVEIIKNSLSEVMSKADLKAYVEALLIRIMFISSSFVVLSVVFGSWISTRYHNVIDRQYEQIKTAHDEADRANIAKSRFLANMSHEIRTPINTIMGMNEMILRENTRNVPIEYSKSIMEYANNVKEASELLLGLVNDVLDISKIESGKVELVEEDYDTEELFQQIIAIIKVKSNEKDLTFETKIDRNLPRVLRGDDQKIKQVVLNLLSNAVKYTEVGGFSLEVKVIDKSSENCSIYIAVKDSGIGIKPENIEKLFSVFKRAEEEDNSSIKGTGLGLDISRRFVELMGGELKCESTYGEGATFSFEIIQKIVSPEMVGDFDEKPINIAPKVYVPSFIAPNARILVVDDNELNLQVVDGLLKATKVKLVKVLSGMDCLEQLEKQPFNLVLLDHMMPKMDGIETLKRIRIDNPNLPVVALTANAMEGGADFYLNAGFDAYLAKPVDGYDLEATIRKFIPNELITEVDESEIRKGIESLPQDLEWLYSTPGITVAEGIAYCGGVDSFIHTLKTFFETLDENADTIEEAYKNNDIKLYTIKVHALKSSARIIGAARLSRMAKDLEDAGNDGAWDFIRNNTDELLYLYRGYKARLIALSESDEDKAPIDEEELKGAYEALREIVPQMDYDGVEMVMDQLDAYKLPAEDAEKIAEFKKLLKKLDWEAMEELIK